MGFLTGSRSETDKRLNYTGYRYGRSNYFGPNFYLPSHKIPFFFFHYNGRDLNCHGFNTFISEIYSWTRGATPTIVPPPKADLTAILLTLFFHIYDCSIEQCRFDKAYVGCVIGTLLGADILKFGKIKHLETLFANIGAEGILDGIFFNGFIPSS